MVKRKRRDLPPVEPVAALPDVLKREDEPSRRFSGSRQNRDRSWDARRSRATYDLPAALIERIRDIAAELGESGATARVSDVARLLLESGLEQYESGALEVKLKPTGFKLFKD